MLSVEAVIYQSVQDSSGSPVQQLGNLCLFGLSTNDQTLNTDDGLLYGKYTFINGTYWLNLYKDSARTLLVASAASGALGLTNVTPANSSGLSGSVYFFSHTADDANIKAVTFLSKDANLPLNNLESISDYDPILGFARFHLEAFQEVKRYLTSREGSELHSPAYLDQSQINGGTGGYDLSRILNWQARELIDASAQFAFAKIAEKEATDPQGMFSMRAKEARSVYRGTMNEFEVDFDLSNTRTTTARRTLSTWKFGR